MYFKVKGRKSTKLSIDLGDGSSKLPCIVYYHGGGWVICNLDSHDAVCRRLCVQSGSVVVSVDYRLAPEHPFPEPLDDCYAALE